MGKRLVRAKNKIREAGVPFSVPDREGIHDRLEAALDVKVIVQPADKQQHREEYDIRLR